MLILLHQMRVEKNKIKIDLWNKMKILQNIQAFFTSSEDYVKMRPIKLFKKLLWFFRDFLSFKRKNINSQFQMFRFYPCLSDNTNNST